VDGLYPGDPGYPYSRETVAYLTGEFPRSPGEEALEPLIAWIDSLPNTSDEVDILWLGAVGDIMPGRGIYELLVSGGGLDGVFTDTLPYLAKADVAAGNLEGAVTVRGSKAVKSYTFRYRPEILGFLKEAGFDYLSITNNHSYDFGETGFLDTLTHLQNAGIGTSGAGTDPVSAAIPSVFQFPGGEIRILSIGAYPPERNGFDGEITAAVGTSRAGILWANTAGLKAVQKAFTDRTFDVLMVHGGVEWSTEPSPQQHELYRRFIDLGADAVIGSHPHYLQGIEIYSGGLIAYSLGNFIFPGMEETAYGEESMILLLGIVENKIRYVELVPVEIDGKTLSIDMSGKILKRVIERSKALN
jgi:poly-gamma-glutamate synthesis protein (capsule biosynthesis protein)